jgi:hypothetical protein
VLRLLLPELLRRRKAGESTREEEDELAREAREATTEVEAKARLLFAIW